MHLFPKYKFITYTSTAWLYEILATIFLGILYSPIENHPAGYLMKEEQKIPLAVMNVDTNLFNAGIFFVFLGLICAFVGHLVDVYDPKNKIVRLVLKVTLSILGCYAVYASIRLLIIFIKIRFING